MANPAWNASGDYFETCTCDYLCPCLSSNLTALPTKGECVFAFAFRVDRGRFADVSLDGLCFALSRARRDGRGQLEGGLIVDERVDAAQEQALAAIASGQAGGPMAALRPLISSFLGVEKRSIRFEKDGLRRSVLIPGVLDQAVEGVPSLTVPGEPPRHRQQHTSS
jgi:hypothetical protein